MNKLPPDSPGGCRVVHEVDTHPLSILHSVTGALHGPSWGHSKGDFFRRVDSEAET